MTLDQAVALSLVVDLSRRDLTERLRAADPELLDLGTRFQERAAAVRQEAAGRGIFFVPWNDARYPALLQAIPDGPPGLWYRGQLACLSAPTVAVVGARAASAGGLETAARLAEGLAARGITVVSGLARGVDSAAHRGALGTGTTAAVLGSGVDHVYPPEHRDLADQIARVGVVLSEYPPGRPSLGFHFPMRNRIISGLSRAVVVVEASDSSGSLITAARALEQGRDVMAVPGSVLSGRNRGGHALLRDGARIVETADDVLSELGLLPAVGSRTTALNSEASTDPLLAAMDLGEPYGVDELASRLGVSAVTLLSRLSSLELEGRVKRAPGGRFVRAS